RRGLAGVRGRAANGDGADGPPAALPRGPAASLPLLLPDVETSRRAGELVRPAGRGASRLHARPRRDRPEVRRPGPASDPGLRRPRRLGMGRDALRRRPGRLQEAHLRDALRSGELAICALRPVLRWHPPCGRSAWRRPRRLLTDALGPALGVT